MWKNEKKSPRNTRNSKSPTYKQPPKYEERNVTKMTNCVGEKYQQTQEKTQWMRPYINEIPKPNFQDDVIELTRRLDQIKMENNLKKSTPLLVESLFDSGNSSPDDFSFNSNTYRTNSMKLKSTNQQSDSNLGNDMVSYPFGSIHLCLPKANFTRISRCSSFNSEDSFCTSDNLSRFY